MTYTPRTNGKAERFIQTGLREWAWLEHYNHPRPHAALTQQPPASRRGLPAFLGSTAGTVPPSRPDVINDRSGEAAQGAPTATGANWHAASLRRPGGPVTLQQGEIHA